MNMNIYENHIYKLRINMSEIVVFAVCFQLEKSSKTKSITKNVKA